MKNKITTSKTVFLLLVLVIFSTQVASAATLYFSPSSGNLSVGNILTVSALVNTQNEAINNADAVINFPAGLLDVVSVNKSGSIFSLWVEEPAFSNSAGTITFNGGLPTPGFNGAAGKIINVVFQVKSAGSASVVFSSGAVRANDGYGTDVLETTTQAQFNLISEERPVAPPPVLGVPQAPNISSPTHPGPNKWYSSNKAIFNWLVPGGVEAARLLVGKIPNATPIVLYVPAINSKTVEDLDDGVWYFHVRLRNNTGWGEASHFRFQIDTEKPLRFEITEEKRSDPTDPRAKFIFDAEDTTSGIDYFEVQIDDRQPEVWRDDGNARYETPVLDPGKHTLITKAVDKAGNLLANSAEFVVEPLEPPIIYDYPKKLSSDEILTAKGATKYPDTEVNIFLQHEKSEVKTYSVKNGKEGEFTFVTKEKLAVGTYTAWAEAIDIRGAKSNPSEIITIIVERPALLRIGEGAISFLAVVIPLAALIFLLVYLSWRWWYKFVTLRKKVRKEIREVERALHKAFDSLKEAIREQIKMLEKTRTRRQLTKEEERIIAQLKKDLDDAERYVRKEIRDIEKEVK